MAGILSLLTPVAARVHVGLLIAVRFLTGVVSGPGFPTAAALWGRWVGIINFSSDCNHEYCSF